MFIKIKNLNFKYPGNDDWVINDFDYSFRKGDIIGILGASGSGKSTLLRLMAGLEVPHTGEMLLNEQVIFNKKRIIKPEKRNIGMVFQDYALFPHMTVSKNIGYGITSRKDKNKRVKEVLKLVEMEDYAKRYPHELSGGQQQRIALARALAPEPSLLLMDEPFSSLDHDLQIKIREELRSIIKKAGITSVFVTHNRENCESISDEIIELENGKIKYNQSKTTSLN
jgi:iron(III) transport system ATP-binding protein